MQAHPESLGGSRRSRGPLDGPWTPRHPHQILDPLYLLVGPRFMRQDVHILPISWTRMRLNLAWMPDPRLMNALMLWTSFKTLRKGHVDSRTDERSDAAVVDPVTKP